MSVMFGEGSGSEDDYNVQGGSNSMIMPASKSERKKQLGLDKVAVVEPIAPAKKLSKRALRKIESVARKKETQARHAQVMAELRQYRLTPEQLSLMRGSAHAQRKVSTELTLAKRRLEAGVDLDDESKYLLVKKMKRAANSSTAEDGSKNGLFGEEEEDDDLLTDSDDLDGSEDLEDLEAELERERLADPQYQARLAAEKQLKESEELRRAMEVHAAETAEILKEEREVYVPVAQPRDDEFAELRRKSRIDSLSRLPIVTSQRFRLPAFAMEQEIVERAVHEDVMIVCGETGSGKSTQVPQFLMEAGFCVFKSEIRAKDSLTPTVTEQYSQAYRDSNGKQASTNEYSKRLRIGVTQPRRVAAVSVCKRVGEELNDLDLVGYQVRFDKSNVKSENCALKFMTDGVLLREVQSDFRLSSYGCIVIDEAHERSINCDILLGLLSRSCQVRREEWLNKKTNLPPLKLVIMSATLRLVDFTENKRLFPSPPPVLTIPARTFPVGLHFAKKTPENYLIAARDKVIQIHEKLPPGSVLVFTTGKREIAFLAKAIEEQWALKQKKNHLKQQQKEKLTTEEAQKTKVLESELEELEAKTQKLALQSVDESTFLDSDGEVENQEQQQQQQKQQQVTSTKKKNNNSKEAGGNDEEDDDDVLTLEAGNNTVQWHEEVLKRQEKQLLERQQLKQQQQQLTNESGKNTTEEQEEQDESGATIQKKHNFSLGDEDDDDGTTAPIGAADEDEEEKYAHLWLGGTAAVPALNTNTGVTATQKEASRLAPSACRLTVRQLHAGMSSKQQMICFKPPEADERVVIISTNVAETSVTLPNVRYVVDCGKEKRNAYMPSSGASRFLVDWAARANVDQRAGRAGRVGPGHCYRLFSSSLYTDTMHPFPPVQLFNTPLDSTLLYLASLGIQEISKFPFPSPPTKEAVKAAQLRLVHLNAIQYVDKKGAAVQCTKEGLRLAAVPLAPRFAKMLFSAAKADIQVVREVQQQQQQQQTKLTNNASKAVQTQSKGVEKISLDQVHKYMSADQLATPLTALTIAALSIGNLFEAPANTNAKEKTAEEREKDKAEGINYQSDIERILHGLEVYKQQGVGAFMKLGGQPRAAEESWRLAEQLSLWVRNKVDSLSHLPIDWMRPKTRSVIPSTMQKNRESVLEGLLDRIATLVEKKGRLAIYKCADMPQQVVDIHNFSSLRDKPPALLAYATIVVAHGRASLRDCFAVDALALAKKAIIAPSLFTIGKPALTPEPKYQSQGLEQGVVTGFFTPTYLPVQLALPAVSYPIHKAVEASLTNPLVGATNAQQQAIFDLVPNLNALSNMSHATLEQIANSGNVETDFLFLPYRLVAKAIIAGVMFPELAAILQTKRLTLQPSVFSTPQWRTNAVARKLVLTLVTLNATNKQLLLDLWKHQPTRLVLLDEILACLNPAFHKNLRNIWPITQ